MTIANNIQKFLKEGFRNSKLKKKDFVKQSGIPGTTFDKIINATQRDIGLRTLLKLSTQFNASVDEIVGRKGFIKGRKSNFNRVSPEDACISIKEFINDKLKETGLSIYQLSKNCGLGEVTLHNFIQDNSSKKMLSTNSIITLGNYFHVALDEIIGRTLRIEHKNQITQTKLSSIFDNMTKEDITSVESIRQSILQKQTKNINHQTAKNHVTKIPGKTDKQIIR